MPFYNASHAAKQIGVSDKTIRRWLAQGKITATRTPSGQLAIAASEVERLRQEVEQERTQFVISGPLPTSLDMTRQVSDVSQSVLTRVFNLEQKVAEQEQRIATLEKHLLSVAQDAKNRPVSLPKGESTRVPTKGPKIANTRARKSGLPEGCILASKFAEQHGVPRPTFIDHMLIGLGPGTVPGEETHPMLPVKEQVDYSERDKPGRKGERERYLTPAQQKAALAFWRRHGVPFKMPETEQEAADDERPWYEPGQG